MKLRYAAMFLALLVGCSQSPPASSDAEVVPDETITASATSYVAFHVEGMS